MSERSDAGSPSPRGAWRVGDRDRDAAVEALGEHFATGRLDRQEYDERTDRAYAARTDHDLAALFTDLPLPHPPSVGLEPDAPAPIRPVRRYSGHEHRHHPGHGYGYRYGHPYGHRHRGPFGPWLLVAVPVVILTGAYWLLWLVPVVLWCVVRPARRIGRRAPAGPG